jgi:hypothetical protein
MKALILAILAAALAFGCAHGAAEAGTPEEPMTPASYYREPEVPAAEPPAREPSPPEPPAQTEPPPFLEPAPQSESGPPHTLIDDTGNTVTVP